MSAGTSAALGMSAGHGAAAGTRAGYNVAGAELWEGVGDGRPPVRTSLVIVSRHRPGPLRCCLAGVAQLDHPDFELIVVADPEGLAVAADMPAKRVAFGEANISAARNAGLAQAAGEVVAFIDDDAVPEPSWLRRLTAPFADPRIGAAGGFVRGRDGISFQWRASTANVFGEAAPLAVDPRRISVFAGGVAHGVGGAGSAGVLRTEGTNCAFRRSALAAIGGFDPGFRFYLDETDVNLRLAAAGHATAIVPLAQVHHGHAASRRRSARRVPLDLSEIGASSALFWRKHAGDAAPEAQAAARARLIAAERARAVRHMVAGELEPREVARLMAGLMRGLEEGAARPCGPRAPGAGGIAPQVPAFLRFPAGMREGVTLAGPGWQAGRLRRLAAEAAAGGLVTTLFLFDPGIGRHRMRFAENGFWEQRGGLWARGHDGEARPRPWRAGARHAREAARVAMLRPVDGDPPRTEQNGSN